VNQSWLDCRDYEESKQGLTSSSPSRSCIIDGETFACDDNKWPRSTSSVTTEPTSVSYRSGRSPDWLKMKNLDAPAVKREEEEDWEKGGDRT
jgi:hypothetical protein